MLEITKRGLEEGLLGVIISDELKWNAHVEYVIAKAAKRLYALRLLKRAGVTPEDMLKVYTYKIRSVFESMLLKYGKIFLHTFLTLLNLYKEEP